MPWRCFSTLISYILGNSHLEVHGECHAKPTSFNRFTFTASCILPDRRFLDYRWLADARNRRISRNWQILTIFTDSYVTISAVTSAKENGLVRKTSLVLGPIRRCRTVSASRTINPSTHEVGARRSLQYRSRQLETKWRFHLAPRGWMGEESIMAAATQAAVMLPHWSRRAAHSVTRREASLSSHLTFLRTIVR